MKKVALFIPLLFLFVGCESSSEKDEPITTEMPTRVDQLKLSQEEAERLVVLPLACIDTEYPNKLNQVIGDDSYLKSPDELHPAFYGCFDWHSAVHGHWSLVKMVKSFPEMEEADQMINGLKQHLTKENIEGEILYFEDELSQGFERMYGWAWLLKLAGELHTWDHPDARVMEENMIPLTDVIVERCEAFIPKLHYPIRVGTHTNTAFAMCMIYDYAEATENESLKKVVIDRAKHFYMNDAGCPLEWEPSGYDFLSPCLEEANIMRRVLSKNDFGTWLDNFLPQLSDPTFALEPGIVADRNDGHLVHLDGLNFSRAWCLFGIANADPAKYGHLTAIGNEHIKHSLPSLVGDSYEGGHWLASFALLSLSE